MRVRLSEGTHEVEIDTHRPGIPNLDEIEAAAYRMLDRLRTTPATESEPDTPFGFSLDSSNERAEPYDDGRGREYEDEDDEQ